MSLMQSNSSLWQLAKDRTRLPRLITGGKSAGRHGMVKQIMLINAALYGLYVVGNGPQNLIYRKYFTLEGSSSITSLQLCHFSHTSFWSFLINSGALYTLGNMHARKFGCGHFVGVIGCSAAAATVLGMMHVYNNNEQTIAGGMGITAGLVTYNAFANPSWFKWMRLHPYMWLTGLALYGAYGNDKAAIGGIAGGYLAFLLL